MKMVRPALALRLDWNLLIYALCDAELKPIQTPASKAPRVGYRAAETLSRPAQTFTVSPQGEGWLPGPPAPPLGRGIRATQGSAAAAKAMTSLPSVHKSGFYCC